ncbi:tetratricopeptide repeat protein [Paraburkholderia sediminicola]|uniref:tetratricopeptide repeat protein n=1 Tax=Paraburkholderia sediminicola TaxID=458836 RepID=UPI0038B8DB19
MAQRDIWNPCRTIAGQVIAVAVTGGCAQLQTNNAGNSSMHKQVKQDDANSQVMRRLLYVIGPSKDFAQAAVWLRKAAEQGRPDAEFMLALDYEQGRGVPSDDSQSIVWYRKAADQGYPAAMIFLGLQASIAHMTGHKDPLGDPALAQKFTDLGVEHAPDLTRDLLPNLWASRAQHERERQMQRQCGRTFTPRLKAMGIDGQ